MRQPLFALLLLLVLTGAQAAVVVRQADVVIDKQTPTPSPIPSQSNQPSQPPQPSVPAPTSPTPSNSPRPSPASVASASPIQTVGTPAPPTASPSANVGSFGSPQPSPSRSPGPAPVSSGLSGGAIAGIVIAAIVIALILALLLFVVLRGGGDEGVSPQPGGYNTPPESGTRAVPAVAAAGAAAAAAGAAGATGGTAASDGTIHDVDLDAQAEATMPGDATYVVSDSARHHSGVAATAVTATAAGAGALGAVPSVPPTEERAPSPPPHDYVVGVGQISSKSDFEDIKTRFARDEIADSAVLGAAPAITAPPPEDEGDTKLPEVSVTPAPHTAVEDAKGTDLLEAVTNEAASFEDKSGDVSVAVAATGATSEIIAEDAAGPSLEQDAMPPPPQVK